MILGSYALVALLVVIGEGEKGGENGGRAGGLASGWAGGSGSTAFVCIIVCWELVVMVTGKWELLSSTAVRITTIFEA